MAGDMLQRSYSDLVMPRADWVAEHVRHTGCTPDAAEAAVDRAVASRKLVKQQRLES